MSDTLDVSVIKKLKVVELKAALSARGLNTKGKKDELVKRLVEAMESDSQTENAPQIEPEVGDEATEEAVDSSQEESQESEPAEETSEVVDGEPSTTTDTAEEVTKETDDKPAGEADWVMVEPPAADETNAVKEASTGQDQAVLETKDAPVQEATVDTQDAEMKEETTTSATTEATGDAKEKKEETDDKNKDAEKKKEEPKVEEIVDEMVAVEVEEGEDFVACEVPEGKVGLDQYSSDMNLVITNNGLNATPLTKNGFSYLWCGARANRGVKGGKIGYEVKITSKKEVDLPETESLKNAIRIGWSSENSGIQLGEASSSYGYESTGKVCASSSFFNYGTTFDEGDVIGTYLDLESEPKSLKYTKNGEDLGVAMSLTINLDEKPLFPHILVRNMAVELNFGENENPWNETLEGFTLLQNADEEQTVQLSTKPIPEDTQPEIILMVGLPSCGKTTWVRKCSESSPDKNFNVISIQSLLERCRIEGKLRKKEDKGFKELMIALMKVLTKFFQMCPKRRRNFIYDQTNVYEKAQKSKMEVFEGFKRKAVVIVPTHDSLRRRTSDSKRKGETIHEVPFGDLCDMKCNFKIPASGDLFDEIIYPELDERNSTKTVQDYHSDGTRAKRTGRDEYYPKKKGRYDDRSRDRRHYGGGQSGGYNRDRRDDRYGGGSGGRRNDYHNRSRSGGQDNNRRYGNSGGGGGNYRQHGGSGGGNHNRSGSGGYNSGYGQNYQQNCNMSGQSYNSGYYNNYNQYGSGAQGSKAPWQQQQQQAAQQQQYGSYQQVPSSTQQQWNQWGSYYNSGSGSGSYGGTGGGYGY